MGDVAGDQSDRTHGEAAIAAHHHAHVALTHLVISGDRELDLAEKIHLLGALARHADDTEGVVLETAVTERVK